MLRRSVRLLTWKQTLGEGTGRFWIEDATVWKLVSPETERVGQAALIRQWTGA
jgi:hypothetical protein